MAQSSHSKKREPSSEGSVTKDHFEHFKAACRWWQTRFGLISYKLYFFHEPLQDSHAITQYNVVSRAVRVTLGTEWTSRPVNTETLGLCAKHEMLHLLLAELNVCGKARYLSPEEIDRAEEAVVFALEHIIQD